MHLMMFSVKRWGESNISLFSVATDDWIATLASKYQKYNDATLAVVFLCELSPLEKRRLAELKQAGVEVEP